MHRTLAAPGRAGLEPAGDVRLSEVVGALTYALDITEGLPMGHAARSCAIGMRIAAAIGLPAPRRSALFYALLLKDAGCSVNASRVAELYGADDIEVKRDRKTLDQHRPGELAAHLVRAAAPGAGPLAKAGRIKALVRHGGEGSRQLTAMRCERGADIARMVGVGEEAAQAIRALDEHWDGSGGPDGLAGDGIPLLGRILCLAQTAEVFHARDGARRACEMARGRAGTWFDPELVAALGSFEGDGAFWERLAREEEPGVSVGDFEPEDLRDLADDERLDTIAEAFAKIIDAKSPFTFRHSEGVAEISVGIARQLGYSDRALRDLRRAALLHDVGKLGVSNRILDKPGKLDAEEWRQMRRHPEHTFRILSRVAAFRPLARVAAAHHEKLDGSGYHLGLEADQLPPAARILAVADICEALTADRPYRGPLPLEKVMSILAEDVPDKLDADCYAALQAHLGMA
jgi:HD-GYP domain-containing protein (c-di-GMP phosphodiesterase class II)